MIQAGSERVLSVFFTSMGKKGIAGFPEPLFICLNESRILTSRFDFDKALPLTEGA
jgi:hypothetical protein